MTFIKLFRESKLLTTLPLAAAACLIGTTSPELLAQENEIEIVNQDGEAVQAIELNPADRPVENTDASTADTQIQTDDGKIVVTNPDGTQSEVDVSGAQSVIVSQSTKSVMKDGKILAETSGKAIVVGPDGERHEIDLGNNGNGAGDLSKFILPMLPGGLPGRMSATQSTVNKFMIGVHCEPVTAALRAQLKLDDEAGLLIDHVGDQSPAAAAGLQPHDILMFADDQQLQTQQDLVDAVQRSGKEEVSLSLTVIRGGQEISVDVSPVERAADQLHAVRPRGPMFDFDGGDGPFENLEFKQFGPGLIIGNGNDDVFADMQAQMQKVQEQMQEMRQRMRAQLQGERPLE